MISDDLRRSYRQRAQALEDSVRRLVSEILASMDPRAQREFRKRLGPRTDLLFTEIDRAIYDDLADDEVTERQDRVREASDRMIELRAEMERLARENRHEMEDLDLSARRRRLERIDEDLTPEL